MAEQILSKLKEKIGDLEEIYNFLLHDDLFKEYIINEKEIGEKSKDEIIEEIISKYPEDLLISLYEGGFEALIHAVSLEEYITHGGKISPDGQIVDMALDETLNKDFEMLNILLEKQIPINHSEVCSLDEKTISLLKNNGYHYAGGRINGPSRGFDSFKYTNSLGRPFKRPKNVKSIIFPISRYGKHEHTLSFESLVSEKDAISQGEKWLNQSYDKEYYGKVKDDLFHDNYTFEEAKKVFSTRGSLLTDLHFLEGADIDKEGNLVLSFGS